MYFGDKSFAVFDIETTGLSPANSQMILSGILLYNGEIFRSIQYFAENPSEEKEVIKNTLETLENVDFVITYNGRHFDIPFMVTRADKLNLNIKILPYNLDLFQVVNGYLMSKELLPNMKQKTIEQFMGLSSSREDEISGAESVSLYKNYVETGSKNAEYKILLHNHDDIIQLYKLLPVIEKCDFHKAMFRLGFPCENGNIDKIRIKNNAINILGSQKGSYCDYICFPTIESPYSIQKIKSTGKFEVEIPCEKVGKALYFDAVSVLGNTDAIKKYPAIENGYLIVESGGEINHLEVNYFVLVFSHLL